MSHILVSLVSGSKCSLSKHSVASHQCSCHGPLRSCQTSCCPRRTHRVRDAACPLSRPLRSGDSTCQPILHSQKLSDIARLEKHRAETPTHVSFGLPLPSSEVAAVQQGGDNRNDVFSLARSLASVVPYRYILRVF